MGRQMIQMGRRKQTGISPANARRAARAQELEASLSASGVWWVLTYRFQLILGVLGILELQPQFASVGALLCPVS